jgi:hypothetical protein
MAAYSLDLRTRVLADWDAGMTAEEVARDCASMDLRRPPSSMGPRQPDVSRDSRRDRTGRCASAVSAAV